VLVLALPCAATGTAADAPWPLPCPSEIATRQEALGVPAGLQAIQAGERRARLLRVGFRAVAADSDVILAPDGSDPLGEDAERVMAVWTFAGDEPIWVSCHYLDTAVALVAPLPQRPMRCGLVLDALTQHSFVSGECLPR
jgi:hypothetical protein